LKIGAWKSQIDPTDVTKIRRLILLQLFEGWRTEAHSLKITRFKASQILARMMRRTKGPMWVKESTLVCFHMWYRYVTVKRCYRLGLMDPRFTNPHLPQWTKLYKQLTIERARKKRTLELGHTLTQRRAMVRWAHQMTVDRSKPVTRTAVAVAHYSRVLSQKIITAWYGFVRDRGHGVRYRDKLFLIWKHWAPKARKLRKFHILANEWLRISRQRKAFSYMTSICLKVIGKRTEKMKELRRNFCDRKLMICAYAFMSQQDHVMMVDCWRRLLLYWKSRKNWKAFNWNLSYSWYKTKAKLIFDAWRTIVPPKKKPVDVNDDPPLPTEEGEEEEKEKESPSQRPSQRRISFQQRRPSSANPGGGGLNYLSLINGDSLHNALDNVVRDLFALGMQGRLNAHRLSEDQFHFFCSVISKAYRKLPYLANLEQSPEELYLVNVPQLEGEQQQQQEDPLLFSPGQSRGGKLSSAGGGFDESEPNSLPPSPKFGQRRGMSSFTNATGLTENDDDNNNTNTTNRQPSALLNHMEKSLSLPSQATTMMDPSSRMSTAPNNKNNQNNGQQQEQSEALAPLASPQTGEELYAKLLKNYSINRRYNIRKEIYHHSLQEKLQVAIDQLNLARIIDCLAQGAIVLSSHIRQVACHIGDHIIPISVLLLTHNNSYFTERFMKDDRDSMINRVHNPIVAYFASTQLQRMEKREFTTREMSTFTQDLLVTEENASKQHSIMIWQNALLHLIELKIKELTHTCLMLPEDRTVDEEVIEVMKRKKIQRLIKLTHSMSKLLGIQQPWALEDRMNTLVPLVANAEDIKNYKNNPFINLTKAFLMKMIPKYDPTLLRSMSSAKFQTDTDEVKSIYVVLREYTLLTGRLALEAKALRGPWLERDARLVTNGYLKQQRRDFLQLRKETMTAKVLEEEREKYRKKFKKLEKKDKKKDRALQKKMKKAKKSSNKKAGGGKKKKGKKGKLSKGASSTTLITDDSGGDEEQTLLDDTIASDFDDSQSEYASSSDYPSERENDNNTTATVISGFTNNNNTLSQDEADFNTLMNANGYNLHDTTDMNNNQIFNIKDLFNELALPEEKEIEEERNFQQRTMGFNSSILAENWLPNVWKAFENKSEEDIYLEFLGLHDLVKLKNKIAKRESNKLSGNNEDDGEDEDANGEKKPIINSLYTQRMLQDLKIIIRRIFTIFQADEALGGFQNMTYTDVMNKYGGVSFYVIEKTLQDKCLRNDDSTSSPLWLKLPSNYWNTRFLKSRLVHENGIMNTLMKEFKSLLINKESKNEIVEKAIKDYEKYLKKLRLELIATIEKSNTKGVSDVEQRKDKMKSLSNTTSNLQRMKNQEIALKKKLKEVQEKVNTNQPEYALFLLNSEQFPLPEDYAEIVAARNAAAAAAALKSSDSADEFTSPLLGVGFSPSTGKSKSKKLRRRSTALPSEFERQQQMETQLATLTPLIEAETEHLQKTQESIVEVEKKIINLQYELKNYDSLCYRTNKLLKNFAEDKFYTIMDIQMLSKRTSKFLTSEENIFLVKQKLFASYKKYVRKLKFFYETILLPKEKELISLAEKRKFDELMKVGGSGLNEYDYASALSPSMNSSTNRKTKVNRGLSRGQSKKGGLMTEDSLFTKNSDLNFDVFSASGTRLTSEGDVIHDVASIYGEEDSIDSATAGTIIGELTVPPPNNQTMTSTGDRPLTVDEEIALLHYNSPEAIAKREAELRALEDQQAKELAVQELKMKIFEQYWSSFPRRNPMDDLHLSRDDGDDDFSSIATEENEEEDLSKIAVGNRSKRMWARITEQYWKQKAAKMKALIEKQRRMHNVEPELIMKMIHLERRDSIDPLDSEFDQYFLLNNEDDIHSHGNSLDWSQYGKEKNKWYHEHLVKLMKVILEDEEKRKIEAEEKAIQSVETKKEIEELKALPSPTQHTVGRLTQLFKAHAVQTAKPDLSMSEAIWKSGFGGGNHMSKMSVSMKDTSRASTANNNNLGNRRPSAGDLLEKDLSDNDRESEMGTPRNFGLNPPGSARGFSREGGVRPHSAHSNSGGVTPNNNALVTPRMAFHEKVTKNDPFCAIGQAEFKRIKSGFQGKTMRHATTGDDDDEELIFSSYEARTDQDPQQPHPDRPSSKIRQKHPKSPHERGRSAHNHQHDRHSPSSLRSSSQEDIREDHSVISALSHGSNSVDHQNQVSEYLELINTPHDTTTTTMMKPAFDDSPDKFDQLQKQESKKGRKGVFDDMKEGENEDENEEEGEEGDDEEGDDADNETDEKSFKIDEKKKKKALRAMRYLTAQTTARSPNKQATNKATKSSIASVKSSGGKGSGKKETIASPSKRSTAVSTASPKKSVLEKKNSESEQKVMMDRNRSVRFQPEKTASSDSVTNNKPLLAASGSSSRPLSRQGSANNTATASNSRQPSMMASVPTSSQPNSPIPPGKSAMKQNTQFSSSSRSSTLLRKGGSNKSLSNKSGEITPQRSVGDLNNNNNEKKVIDDSLTFSSIHETTTMKKQQQQQKRQKETGSPSEGSVGSRGSRGSYVPGTAMTDEEDNNLDEGEEGRGAEDDLQAFPLSDIPLLPMEQQQEQQHQYQAPQQMTVVNTLPDSVIFGGKELILGEFQRFPASPLNRSRSFVNHGAAPRSPTSFRRNDSFKVMPAKDGNWDFKPSERPNSPPSPSVHSRKGGSTADMDHVSLAGSEKGGSSTGLVSPTQSFILQGKQLKREKNSQDNHQVTFDVPSQDLRDIRLVDTIGLKEEIHEETAVQDNKRVFVGNEDDDDTSLNEKNGIQEIIHHLQNTTGDDKEQQRQTEADERMKVFIPKISFFPPSFQKAENSSTSPHLFVANGSQTFDSRDEYYANTPTRKRQQQLNESLDVGKTPTATPSITRFQTRDSAFMNPAVLLQTIGEDMEGQGISLVEQGGEKTVRRRSLHAGTRKSFEAAPLGGDQMQLLSVTSSEYNQMKQQAQQNMNPFYNQPQQQHPEGAIEIHNIPSFDLGDSSAYASLKPYNPLKQSLDPHYNHQTTTTTSTSSAVVVPPPPQSAISSPSIHRVEIPQSIYHLVGPSLPKEKNDQVSVLQNELRKFLKSREEERVRSAQPPVVGQLRINESKATDMSSAEQEKTNFYELTVPTTSSKRYQRIFYDHKQQEEKEMKIKEIKDKNLSVSASKYSLKLKSTIHDANLNRSRKSSKDPNMTPNKETVFDDELILSTGRSSRPATGEFWVNVSKVSNDSNNVNNMNNNNIPQDMQSIISGDSLETEGVEPGSNYPMREGGGGDQDDDSFFQQGGEGGQGPPQKNYYQPSHQLLYNHSLREEYSSAQNSQNKSKVLVMQGKKLMHPIKEELREPTMEEVRNGPVSPLGDRKSPLLFSSLAGNTFNMLQAMKPETQLRNAPGTELDPFKKATHSLAGEGIVGSKKEFSQPPEPVFRDYRPHFEEKEGVVEGGGGGGAGPQEPLGTTGTTTTAITSQRRRSRENNNSYHQIIKEITGEDEYDAYYKKRLQDGTEDGELVGGEEQSSQPSQGPAVALPLKSFSPVLSPNNPSLLLSSPHKGGGVVSRGVHAEESYFTVKTPTYPSVTVPYDPRSGNANRLSLPKEKFHMAHNPTPMEEAKRKYKFETEENKEGRGKGVEGLLQVKNQGIHSVNPLKQQQYLDRQKLQTMKILSQDSLVLEKPIPLGSSSGGLELGDDSSSILSRPSSSNLSIVIARTSNSQQGSRRNSRPTTSEGGGGQQHEFTQLEVIPSASFDYSQFPEEHRTPLNDSIAESRSELASNFSQRSRMEVPQLEESFHSQHHQQHEYLLNEDDEEEIERELRDLLLYENAAASSSAAPVASHYNLDNMNPLYPSSVPKGMTLPSVDKHFMEKINPSAYQKKQQQSQQKKVGGNQPQKKLLLDPLHHQQQQQLQTSQSDKLVGLTSSSSKNQFHNIRRKQAAYLPPLALSASTSQLPASSASNHHSGPGIMDLSVLASSMPVAGMNNNNHVNAKLSTKPNMRK
jgi:hypothetical protein